MQEVDGRTQDYTGATNDAGRLTVATQRNSRPAAGPSAMDAAGRLSRARGTAARRGGKGSTRAAEVVRRYGTGARAAGCGTSGDLGPEMHPSPGPERGAKSGACARRCVLRGAGWARAILV